MSGPGGDLEAGPGQWDEGVFLGAVPGAVAESLSGTLPGGRPDHLTGPGKGAFLGPALGQSSGRHPKAQVGRAGFGRRSS